MIHANALVLFICKYKGKKGYVKFDVPFFL